MKFREYDISKRVSGENLDLPVSKETYVASYMDILDFLFTDLWTLMRKENRLRGIVLKYQRTIQDTYRNINSGVGEKEIELYGRVLFLFKPALREEFKRLTVKRGLSEADAVICIIKKFLDIITEVYPDYSEHHQVEAVKDIVDKLHDYIRNHAKKDSFFSLANLIRKCLQNKSIGKFRVDEFTINRIEPEKTVLEAAEEKLSIESENKLEEVCLLKV